MHFPIIRLAAAAVLSIAITACYPYETPPPAPPPQPRAAPGVAGTSGGAAPSGSGNMGDVARRYPVKRGEQTHVVPAPGTQEEPPSRIVPAPGENDDGAVRSQIVPAPGTREER